MSVDTNRAHVFKVNQKRKFNRAVYKQRVAGAAEMQPSGYSGVREQKERERKSASGDRYALP